MAARLTDEQLREAVELKKRYGTDADAARAAGIARPSFRHRLEEAAKAGLFGTDPVIPGFRLSKVSTVLDADGNKQREFIQQTPDSGEQFEVPEGHAIKGISALVDANGRTVAKWIKTKEGELDPAAVVEWLKEAFRTYEPAARRSTPPEAPAANLLTLFPCNDWHIGLYTWGKETAENWDLKIAEDRIGRSIEDTLARSPSSAEAIVLGGGDLLHADNKENQTARSGHALDVDGRYQKVLLASARLMVRTVDAALARHEHVTVRMLPGNHDEHSAVAVAYFLLAWYRNDPRVTVDVDPSLFFWFRFGLVMLGATHGHTVKMDKMPGIMAHRRAEDWGATKFRYVHGFHIHHSSKIATEGNGVICESHQAPVPQDAWHFGAGFLSGRSLQAITYHRDYGEIGRVRTAILDAKV